MLKYPPDIWTDKYSLSQKDEVLMGIGHRAWGIGHRAYLTFLRTAIDLTNQKSEIISSPAECTDNCRRSGFAGIALKSSRDW